MNTKVSLSPIPLGYLTALLPLATMHLCFFISVYEGYIDACIPYWIDCASISKSGRYGTAYFVFKGGMISAAIFMFLFWQLNRYWLRVFHQQDDQPLKWLATIGVIALIIYVLALGHGGDTFRQLRRTGVIFFMFCSFIALVRIAAALAKTPALSKQGRHLLQFNTAILSIAIFSVILNAIIGHVYYDRFEDAFEWLLMLLLNLQLFWITRLWQHSGFTLEVTQQT